MVINGLCLSLPLGSTVPGPQVLLEQEPPHVHLEKLLVENPARVLGQLQLVWDLERDGPLQLFLTIPARRSSM